MRSLAVGVLIVFLEAASCQTLSRSTSTLPWSQGGTQSELAEARTTAVAGGQERNEVDDDKIASSPVGVATFASLGLLFLLFVLLAIYTTRQKLKIIRLQQMIYAQTKQDLDRNPLYNSGPFNFSVRPHEAAGLPSLLQRNAPIQHDSTQTAEHRELVEASASAQVKADIAQKNIEGSSILASSRGQFDSPLDTHGPHGSQTLIVSSVNDDVSFSRSINRKTSSAAGSEHMLIQFSSSSSEVDTNSRRTTLSRGMQPAALDTMATPPLPRRSLQQQQYAVVQTEEQAQNRYERFLPGTLEPVTTLAGSHVLADRRTPIPCRGFAHSAMQEEGAGAGGSLHPPPPNSHGSLPRNINEVCQPQANNRATNLNRATSRSLPSVASHLVDTAHEYDRPSSVLMAAMDSAQMRHSSREKPGTNKGKSSFKNCLYGVTTFAVSRSQSVEETTHLAHRKPTRRESGLYSTVHVNTSGQLGSGPLFRGHSEPSLADLK